MTAEQMRRVKSFYHVVIFMANRTDVDEQVGQEMKTLAQVLDCLCEGDLARLGDVGGTRLFNAASMGAHGIWLANTRSSRCVNVA